MPLEEDRDAALDHELMDGQFPAGAFLGEFPGAAFVPAAPFPEVAFIDAAAARAHHMVGENNLNLACALVRAFLSHWYWASPSVMSHQSRSLVRPALRRRPGADCPPAGRMPVVVQYDKQGVAPGPRVIIAQAPMPLSFCGIAGVKAVRRGHGEEAVACGLRPRPQCRGQRPSGCS